LVRVYLRPHPTLKRDGDDLYAVAAITFPDAALGTKVSIPCLGNETVIIIVPPGTQHGALLRARGKGMPRLHGRGKGDLYVVVEVKTPTELTPRQRELLREFKMETSRKAAATASCSSAAALAAAGIALFTALAAMTAWITATD
jgi:molecular chaperone DnaJ